MDNVQRLKNCVTAVNAIKKEVNDIKKKVAAKNMTFNDIVNRAAKKYDVDKSRADKMIADYMGDVKAEECSETDINDMLKELFG